MDTPTHSLNEQHLWGGNPYMDTGQSTPEPGANIGQQALAIVNASSSQAHLVASDSDTLFAPTMGRCPSITFILPDVPHRPVLNHAYSQFPSHIPSNREHLSAPHASHLAFIPFSSSLSSYNNPAFTVPPLHEQYAQILTANPLPYQPPVGIANQQAPVVSNIPPPILPTPTVKLSCQ
ncbi:hypothetical protein CPB84DRAFT_1238001 [Gymnopilus junonius]|uniref:Uncharacterized protein n=1 Tax=Gymnopilus junonius TaxID=109634 RepID=A0A9P5NYC4_GYMJU|nr:hypothetical protein CPB84DRAFT_1238001 [Gymnopilus junonius]